MIAHVEEMAAMEGVARVFYGIRIGGGFLNQKM
jgi:hypothetical protein